MKKLIIQIPCFNEEESLPATLAALPLELEGVDVVEYLIINDGSVDRTVEVARALGVHHIVNFSNHKGLAKGFSAGLDACLKLGADIIVNTDADNQYNSAYIQQLIQPILDGHADMVVGDRRTDTIEHFSVLKKWLQRWGSWTVRKASHTDIPDTTSGFRAFNREAALRLNVVSEYTYTLETIIQAGRTALSITHVPIGVTGKTRPSRLLKNIQTYVSRSMGTILRIYTMYSPLKVFGRLGFVAILVGMGFLLRYLWFFLQGEGVGHVQSVILGGVLLIVGFQTCLIGLVADLIAGNRRLTEDTLYRVRKMELMLLRQHRDLLPQFNGQIESVFLDNGHVEAMEKELNQQSEWEPHVTYTR